MMCCRHDDEAECPSCKAGRLKAEGRSMIVQGRKKKKRKQVEKPVKVGIRMTPAELDARVKQYEADGLFNIGYPIEKGERFNYS